jgi:hypothetical protein
MGDFNINLEADSSEKRELLLDILDIFFHFNGSHAPLYAPPAALSGQHIDLILSSIPDSLRSTTPFGCPGISHHDFVGASFEIIHIRQPNWVRRLAGVSA